MRAGCHRGPRPCPSRRPRPGDCAPAAGPAPALQAPPPARPPRERRGDGSPRGGWQAAQSHGIGRPGPMPRPLGHRDPPRPGHAGSWAPRRASRSGRLPIRGPDPHRARPGCTPVPAGLDRPGSCFPQDSIRTLSSVEHSHDPYSPRDPISRDSRPLWNTAETPKSRRIRPVRTFILPGAPQVKAPCPVGPARGEPAPVGPAGRESPPPPGPRRTPFQSPVSWSAPFRGSPL